MDFIFRRRFFVFKGKRKARAYNFQVQLFKLLGMRVVYCLEDAISEKHVSGCVIRRSEICPLGPTLPHIA